jgi:hypothetical protein
MVGAIERAIKIKDGTFLTAYNPLNASQNTVYDNPVSGRYFPAEIVDYIDIDVLRLFSATQAFGCFLHPDFLRVDEA